MPPNARIWPGRDVVAGVARQARVEHLGHRGVVREQLDHLHRVVAVPVHPDAERLDATQHQPRVERPGDRAHRVLVEGELVSDLGVGRDDRAADDVGVAAEVLRRRVHHQVGAERRAAAAGRARRRCCRRPAWRPTPCASSASAAMSAMPSSGLVGVSHQMSRVVGTHRGAHRVQVGQRHRRVLHAPVREHPRDQPERAAVGVARQDHVIARAAQRAEQGVLGREPAGEGQPACAGLQRGERVLQRGAGRVRAAAVLVAAAQATHAVLLVGRGLVDRDRDGARQRVRLLARVDRPGVETPLWVQVCHG